MLMQGDQGGGGMEPNALGFHGCVFENPSPSEIEAMGERYKVVYKVQGNNRASARIFLRI